MFNADQIKLKISNRRLIDSEFKLHCNLISFQNTQDIPILPNVNPHQVPCLSKADRKPDRGFIRH